MAAAKPKGKATARKRRLAEAVEILTALQFGSRQSNEIAAYTLLALLDLRPDAPWSAAEAPLRGITPIIDFIADAYGVRYAPNTRETIRDEAVKFFAESALLLRNPDEPSRPTNSGKTVYQVEPWRWSWSAGLARWIGRPRWRTIWPAGKPFGGDDPPPQSRARSGDTAGRLQGDALTGGDKTP